MKRAFVYLIALLAIYTIIGIGLATGKVSIAHPTLRLAVFCALFGGIGGVTYCLRGIYLNACVLKTWDEVWLPWYFIRPILSIICGVISCLFLKAGLIVFEAQQTSVASNFAFFALSFIAGLNVDKFIEKIEDLAQTTWGIKRTRTSSKEE